MCLTKVFSSYDRFSTAKHLFGNKNHTAICKYLSSYCSASLKAIAQNEEPASMGV